MKSNNALFYRITATAAGCSALLLIGMAFIAFPQGLEYPGVAVLTGELVLSPADQAVYAGALRMLFLLDGLFLLGWLVSWVGIAQAARERMPLFGLLALVFGLAGALLDFSENSIIWGVFQNLNAGRALNTDWLVPWKAVQHLSYWLPFTGALFASFGLWGGNWRARVTAVVGSVLVVIAAAGMYLPALALLPNVWFLLWFVSSSVMLWEHSRVE